MMRLRMGKFCGAGKSADGELADQRSAGRQDAVGDLLVLARIDHVNARPEDGDGLALAHQRAAMRGGIDTAGHAAGDHQAEIVGEIAGQTLGHAHTVGGRVTCADHRDAGRGKRVHVPADIHHDRRIVDLAQQGRIRGIVEREDMGAGVRGLPQLFLRQRRRLPGCDRLGGRGVQPAGFQLGERSAEDALRRAEVFGQLAGARRPQAGSQGQR